MLYKKRIGILGGTFNPIHVGHLVMAEEVCKCHNLSKVIFVPTNIPPHKYTEDLADTHHRYRMVKEAISGNDKFAASDMEIKREGKSYTIDTVQEILHSSKEDSEIYLIMGADSLEELEIWKDVKKLSRLCHFVIVNRPGYSTNVSNRLADAIGKEKVLDIERLRIEIEPVGVSSTEIRKKLKGGADINGLVSPCVDVYIREYGLYSHS